MNTDSNIRIAHQPREKAAKVLLDLAPGQSRYFYLVYYRGTVKKNVAGTWLAGCKEPLWVATNIPAKAALQL